MDDLKLTISPVLTYRKKIENQRILLLLNSNQVKTFFDN